VYNARKNFTATEFKQLTASMLIEVKEVPVKAHNSVGQVKRYHTLLRRTYKILKAELKDKHINKEIILQIAVKAVNDSARPDEIILTLLVFGSYPRITEIDLFHPVGQYKRLINRLPRLPNRKPRLVNRGSITIRAP
jgi:hypothetical protein